MKRVEKSPNSKLYFPMIDSYSFGCLVVDGKRYTNDVIILPDRVIANWWRDEGHRLKDLPEIDKVNLDTLIIGTGAYGAMKVTKELNEKFEGKGIKVIIAPTKEAVELYNSSVQERTAACLHLTC